MTTATRPAARTPKKPLVVDGDGHILEPRDLWEKRVPPEFKDKAIKVVWNEATQLEDECIEGVALIQGRATTNGWARSPMSRRRDCRGWRWEQLPAAGLDPRARVAELDRDGIDVAVLYPSLGLLLGGIKDARHAVAAHRIYNDWLHEFASVAPKRLIGVAAVPMQDPEASVLEAKRALGSLGMRGLFVRPNAYNGRMAHDKVFDPLWAAVQETGLPVGLHPAGTAETFGAPQAYNPWWGDSPAIGKPINFLVDDLYALTMLIGTGVLDRFPALKVIVLEAGGGWLPHWIDKMDHWVDVVPAKGCKLKPSEYIRRQVWVSCDPDEKTMPYIVASFGADRLIWASDYPHMDVIAPSATEELKEGLEGMSRRNQVKILGANAKELYGL